MNHYPCYPFHINFFIHEKGIPFKAVDYLMHSTQGSVTKCDVTLSKLTI